MQEAVRLYQDSMKPPLSVKLITYLYMGIAMLFVVIFIHTHLCVPMGIGQRIIGILLGLLIGYSVFFIGQHVWKGSSWARVIVITISIFIVVASTIGYLLSTIKSLHVTLYFASIIALNLLIIRYLYTQTARRYFSDYQRIEAQIKHIITKYYEKESTQSS
jgi:hypothetical protein